jgi:hypothetical protein
MFFASAATGVSAIPGVHKVDVNPFTGSILILHERSLKDVGIAAAEASLFTIGNANPAPITPPAIAIDPKLVVGAGLGVLALSELINGRIMPPAITLAWYAASLTGLISNIGSVDGGE